MLNSYLLLKIAQKNKFSTLHYERCGSELFHISERKVIRGLVIF